MRGAGIMLKEGYYCMYHGKEYCITGIGGSKDKSAYIYTKNRRLVDNSFFVSHSGYYKKKIQYGEVDEAYEITPWDVFGNIRKPIENETEDRYIIYTSETDDEEVIERYHLKWIDRGEMGGWISKDQAEVKYFRRDIDYFGDWKKKLGRESEGYGEAYEIFLDEE